MSYTHVFLHASLSLSDKKLSDVICNLVKLVGHGVSEELLQTVKMEIQGFFKLPLEEKAEYEQLPDDVEGYGQAFVVSEGQKLDWADMFYMTVLPVSMRKPHLLPKLPQPMRLVVSRPLSCQPANCISHIFL